ncbi:MAG: tetratricopeptide repeat protein [Pseudomonadota bacterium]
MALNDPHSPTLARAADMFRAGQLDQAEAIYRQVVAAAPDHVAAHADLASVLHSQGRYQEAIAALNPGRCSSHRPWWRPSAIWWFASRTGALHLQRQGRLDDAIALHRKALAFDATLVRAHNNLGAALLMQGHADQAIACFRAAIALEPTRAEFISISAMRSATSARSTMRSRAIARR